MSPDVKRKDAGSRLGKSRPAARLWSRAARIASWVVIAALVGSFAQALLPSSSSGERTALAATSDPAADLKAVQKELAKAKADLKAEQAKLDKLAAKQAAAENRDEATKIRIEKVQAKTAAANKKLAALQTRLQSRIRDIYMDRGSATLEVIDAIISGDMSLDTVIKQLKMLSNIAHSDSQLVADVTAQVKELKDLNTELQSQKKQEQVDYAQLVASNQVALQAMESSKDSYNSLHGKVAALQAEEAKRQEAARQLAAAQAKAAAEAKAAALARANTQTNNTTTTTKHSSSGTTKTTEPTDTSPPPANVSSDWVFPVQGPNSFVDSWGAPRSGGRTHKGTDIMTARNTPIVAVVKGVIGRTTPTDTGLGGITIYLNGSDGNSYYYAHLSSVKSGIQPGVHVTAGEVIGYAGNTGNAAGGAVHLHFEYHPGGGAAAPSYALLMAHR